MRREFSYTDKGGIFERPKVRGFIPDTLNQLHRTSPTQSVAQTKLTLTSVTLVQHTPRFGGTETNDPWPPSIDQQTFRLQPPLWNPGGAVEIQAAKTE